MKRNFTLLAFTLTILAMVKYANLTSRPASVPTGGYAGEPTNNQTCANSGCHSGTATVDASKFTIKMATTLGGLSTGTVTPATTFVPGTTYKMSLQLNGTANRYGFTLASQDASNAQAGTFNVTDATNTAAVAGGNGRINMGHKNANANIKSWVWEWTAPSTLSTVNLFYAGMLSNGDSGSGGDLVYNSSVSITGAPNAIEDIKSIASFNVFPTQTLSDIALNISATENTTATLVLVNMTGQVVKELYNGEFSVGDNNLRFNISDIPAGNYIMSLKTPTASAAKRIVKL